LNFSNERTDVKRCGEERIENCKECGKGEESNSCSICEVDHFLLLENLLCISCTDPILGQVGCQGECDSSDYSNSGFAYCKECKEGYYNLEGLCHECEVGSPGCEECTYVYEETSENKIFKCLKCLNEEEYIINEDFLCEKCNDSQIVRNVIMKKKTKLSKPNVMNVIKNIMLIQTKLVQIVISKI
jgi:hypothetical protein